MVESRAVTVCAREGASSVGGDAATLRVGHVRVRIEGGVVAAIGLEHLRRMGLGVWGSVALVGDAGACRLWTHVRRRGW